MFRALLILALQGIFYTAGAQSLTDFSKAKVSYTDSGMYLIENIRTGCKSFYKNVVLISAGARPAVVVSKAHANIQQEKLFVLHGNLTYNFNYRSYIDTPFAEHDMMQHSVQARFNVKLKDKYPFTVYLTSRRSNSPYFSNATDVSFQFRRSEMLEDIKKKMRTDAESILTEKSLLLTPAQLYQREKDGIIKNVGSFAFPDAQKGITQIAGAAKKETEEKFKKLYGDYKAKMDKLAVLQEWAKHSSRIQEQVEEKEKGFRKDADKKMDSLKNTFSKSLKDTYGGKADAADSIFKSAKATAEAKRKEADSLKKEIARAEKELKTFQKKVIDSVQNVKKQIAAITDGNSLKAYLQKTGQQNTGITRLQKALLSVKQIGIGRTWIDYSELTVKNISLNGINVEANPGNVYLAAAAGKVNYRFRDYIVKGSYAGSGQSVGLIRAGFGKKDRNNFIVTYYTGKKALLNQRSIADSQAVQNISGISLETRMAIDANNYLTAEYTRSESPALKGKILDLKNNSNEAWCLKLFTHYGNTKFTGYYRRTGENFQSFTLFPTNNKQDAWMLKGNQSFYKKQIVLEAAVRKNDFNSPVALPALSNKNVFKSFQITERIAKYPFVSLGYYPSSQLTLSNNNVLYENRYNTLNAIVNHNYFIGGLNMNSNVAYTKFYNSGSDSGFIYYNAATLILSHSVTLSRFVFQGIFTLTEQSQLYQQTLEPGVTYRLKNILSITGRVRWSRVNHTETLWGGTAGLNLYMNKLGVLQLQYDKIWLPGYNRNLLPVDMGRLTFSREF